MTAAVQTLWAELVAGSLADCGVRTCVISPGSRSTPLVAALARIRGLDLHAIIDERAAAFFALGAARATGEPAAIVCTSGTAAAHYLPAIVEASASGVPLVVLTADRPPELQQCGATQTIDQVKMYGDFVRGAFDLGAPVGSAVALRAVRRKIVQAVSLARGPQPGPVHIQVPLRKPLEPAAPSDGNERSFAALVAELRTIRPVLAPPRLQPDPSALAALASAIASEPRGIVVCGALPARCSDLRDQVFALCARAGYPLLAEAGSQLRFAARPGDVVAVDAHDIVLGAAAFAGAPVPRLIVQLGAEPVSAGWQAAQPLLAGAARWVLAPDTWRDPDSSARAVILGELAASLSGVLGQLASDPRVRNERSFQEGWRDAARRASGAIDRALAAHPRSEAAVVRAAIDAVPPGTTVQIGNSLPIRVVDQVCAGGTPRTVLAQRGAAGIDGLIASAAGATCAGSPVVLVLGDVSFAHDVGALLAARDARAPLAIVVIDNGGGRIFGGLPVAKAGLGDAFERHFVTPPGLDPAVVAGAFGARAVTAASPAEVADAVTTALSTTGVTIVHAPCTVSGAHDVRRLALELAATGGSHA